MPTQTPKTKAPHYHQVWKQFENVKRTLCANMGIGDQEYYNQEFKFGIDFLNQYCGKLQSLENFKTQVLQNPIIGYWPFIKSQRRQYERTFWQCYEIVYEDNLEDGLKVARTLLREEWEHEHRALARDNDMHERLRHFIINANLTL